MHSLTATLPSAGKTSPSLHYLPQSHSTTLNFCLTVSSTASSITTASTTSTLPLLVPLHPSSHPFTLKPPNGPSILINHNNYNFSTSVQCMPIEDGKFQAVWTQCSDGRLFNPSQSACVLNYDRCLDPKGRSPPGCIVSSAFRDHSLLFPNYT